MSRILSTVALVLPLVLGACSSSDAPDERPAGAASATGCPSWTPKPALVRDAIDEVTVLHVSDTVAVTLHQRDVVDSRAPAWTFHVATPSDSWSVDVFRTGSRERLRTEAWLLPDEEPEPPPSAEVGDCGLYGFGVSADDCRGLTGDVDAKGDVVRVFIPRRCLGDPAWVRAGAEAYEGQHDVSFSDPVLGPKVPVS